MTSSGVTKIPFWAIKIVALIKPRNILDQTKVSWGIYRKLYLIMKETPFYLGKIFNEESLMVIKKLAFIL